MFKKGDRIKFKGNCESKLVFDSETIMCGKKVANFFFLDTKHIFSMDMDYIEHDSKYYRKFKIEKIKKCLKRVI